MSKIFALVTTVALFTGLAAFAQDAASPTDAKTPTATASAEAPSSGMKAHKMHHGANAAHVKGSGTDWDANKLNACMVNAIPTAADESCLKQASQS